MSESLDVLKLRVLLCFLNEEQKTCTVTGLAGVLGEGKQKVSRMLIRAQPVFPHDACETEHAVSQESSAALQRLLPGNKYKGEENQ